MGTKVRFVLVPNYQAVLNAERGVKDIVHAEAEQAAAIARDLAPTETGDYRDGIGVDADGNLVATDWKSHWIEWGSEPNAAYAVLRNAANEVAAKVIEVGKP